MALGETDLRTLDGTDEMVGIPMAWPVKARVAVAVLFAKNESLATCNWELSIITFPIWLMVKFDSIRPTFGEDEHVTPLVHMTIPE